MKQQLIYLDHAATTPMDPAVLAAMQPYLTGQFYNPSATYLAARSVKKDLEAARVRVAHWLGARPAEVTFTAGGTEANNLAIHGVMSQYPDGNIVVSAIEHDSVLQPASQYDCRIAPVKPDGMIDLGELDKLIDDKTVLVSVMYANNEIGTIQPIRQIAKLIAEKRAIRGQSEILSASTGELPAQPVALAGASDSKSISDSAMPLFHTDACQASAYLDLHAARLGVDLLTINASKIYGPKQVGALYIKAGLVLEPLMRGGGQERGLRSGTENVASVVGFAAALDLVQNRKNDELLRLQDLQQLFWQLLAEALPGAVINGSLKHRLANNLHITLPGQDNERLMMLLDEQGIMVAVGSACSASSEKPSHVLGAIGLSDADAQASLRLTMGHSTDEAAIRHTVATLSTILS